MPFVVADMQAEKVKLQQLIDSDPALKTAADEWDKEYEFRKKMVLARKEAGLTQKELEQVSGLDQRTISRMEVDEKISPSVKTLRKYLNALGYELDIVKAVG